jgi:hypothetical protein
VELIGALSNHELRVSLVRLTAKAGSPPQAIREAPQRYARRRRPGSIRAAIVATLSAAQEPMRSRDIHHLVETILGGSVQRGSVKAALIRDRRFQREGGGTC